MEKIMNYHKEMEKILSDLSVHSSVPSLLLHSCCAPCSSYVLGILSTFFWVTVFYYNPNIAPMEEYELRKREQKRLIKCMPSEKPIEFLDCDYDGTSFERISIGLEHEPEKGKRCLKCYQLRLERTAQTAKRLSFDFFGTTLTVSPYKNAIWLNKLGIKLAKQYHVQFLPADFKKNGGYQKSIALSKQYGLYRQNFCGCVFSKDQRLSLHEEQR